MSLLRVGGHCFNNGKIKALQCTKDECCITLNDVKKSCDSINCIYRYQRFWIDRINDPIAYADCLKIVNNNTVEHIHNYDYTD